MEIFSSNFTLGILGGGQLGKMLLYDTRKFDIRTIVLDPSPDAPSAIACDEFFTGDLMDFQTVYEFGRKADVITIEIEHVNIDALEKLQQEGKNVFPSPQTLRLIQDKGIQKDFYRDNEIPTAPYSRFESVAELISASGAGKVTLPFIWKSARFGYDGNGVKAVRTADDLRNLPQGSCIAEDMIQFEMELAVIVARTPSGESRAYPVVEMEFHPEANQVEYVITPARISDEIAGKAIQTALLVSEKFQHVGLLAVEMFLTRDGQILVNEVAPRPHNSGHCTIESGFTSQFEQHLRAILGLPLGSTENKVAGVMVNLVGEDGQSGDVVYENISEIMAIPGVTPHIYGKKQTRPFRKMGHVTIVSKDLSEARRIAAEVKSTIRVVARKNPNT